MGIQGLAKLIADIAPAAIKESEIKNYFGRKVALDASMCLYQFLIAVRQDGAQLATESGEVTSHLLGFFYRTIRMIENGIKPVYVFDGKPPQLKSGELEKRKEAKEMATKAMEAALEAGEEEEAQRMARRTIRVTKEHHAECRRLLTLMGIPFVDAPGEAEAQCAELVKNNKVFAAGTEDMDALTFGSSVLLRHLTFSEARKMPIKEFHLHRVLSELGFSQVEFIDLCILLGCDYVDGIKGVGPKRAIELIQRHRTIEAIIDNLDLKKHPIPENWMYKEARKLFTDPDVTPADKITLNWTAPDEDQLVEFLVKEKNFNEERVRNGCKKLQKARTTSTQSRLENFFQLQPAPLASSKDNTNDAKPSTPKASQKRKGGPIGKGNAKVVKPGKK